MFNCPDWKLITGISISRSLLRTMLLTNAINNSSTESPNGSSRLEPKEEIYYNLCDPMYKIFSMLRSARLPSIHCTLNIVAGRGNLINIRHIIENSSAAAK